VVDDDTPISEVLLTNHQFYKLMPEVGGPWGLGSAAGYPRFKVYKRKRRRRAGGGEGERVAVVVVVVVVVGGEER